MQDSVPGKMQFLDPRHRQGKVSASLYQDTEEGGKHVHVRCRSPRIRARLSISIPILIELNCQTPNGNPHLTKLQAGV